MSNLEQNTTNKSLTVLIATRPWQWIKNSFVLAPLLFSGQFSQLPQCLRTALAFASFCAVSSAVYVINDLCDRREDRQHPLKRLRPIASGAISTTSGVTLALALTIIGLAVSITLGRLFLPFVVVYFGITVAYSVGLKHVAILDVMIIAAGFVLRILGGSAAINVSPSHWLVLCTIMISLFLGFAKRRAELVTVADSGESTGTSRIVLKDYSIAFLDQVIPIVTAATIVCYALYTVDQRTLEAFGTRAMVITVPCVMYGLFRYVYIVYHLKKGEDPTQTLLRDVPTIANIIVWIVLSLCVVIYGAKLTLF